MEGEAEGGGGARAGHCWILEEKMDIALGLYFISTDGRGGHTLTVCQYTKDHLCISFPDQSGGRDMILFK